MAADEGTVLGKGSAIEFGGKTYKFSPITYDIQAEYTTWLKRRAVEEVREQKSYLTPEEYERKMDRVDRNRAAGVYSFAGELCRESVHSLEGLKYLVFLTLKSNHPEVDMAFIDQMFESKEIMEQASRAIKSANSDPLGVSPPKTETAG